MLQGKFKRAVAFAIGAWVAQACLTSSTVAPQQPKRGGTLVFGINSGDPPTYDCHQSTLFPIIHLLSPHYSNLLRIDIPNYPKVVGDLAESWTVADDAKTYSSASAPASSSTTARRSRPRTSRRPTTACAIRRQGVVSVRQGLVADIDSIETPDPLSVIFRLKRPNRALLYAFANPFNCVYSAAKLKENPTFPVRNVMGTGPIQLRRARGRRALEGRALQGLLQARPALPRRLPRHLHARARRSSTRCRAARSWPTSAA